MHINTSLQNKSFKINRNRKIRLNNHNKVERKVHHIKRENEKFNCEIHEYDVFNEIKVGDETFYYVRGEEEKLIKLLEQKFKNLLY